jgi:hypothetical protein
MEHLLDDLRPGLRVRPGGLMRCCLSMLGKREMTATKMPKEGEKLRCIYCGHSMVYCEDAWEWAGGPRA